jgi:hypothetical protein
MPFSEPWIVPDELIELLRIALAAKVLRAIRYDARLWYKAKYLD